MKENLSIILIAHNEEANISKMVEGLISNYSKEILELIVVDDASTDSTASIVDSWSKKNPKVRLVKRVPPCGVGRALKTGFSSVNPKSEYVLTMDSDFTENIKDVAALIRKVEEGNLDGVIGSRFVKGGAVVNYPLLKKLMNRMFHILVKALFSIKQNDLTNNFKLYKTEIVRRLPWKSDDYAMNAETGILPIVAGYRVAEVPVYWIGRSAHMGRSKFRLFKVGRSYIRVISYAWNFIHNKKF